MKYYSDITKKLYDNVEDLKKAEREQFYKQYLYPNDGVMPSDKIFEILKTTIGK